MITTIGLLESNSIAVGYEIQDAMLKAGAVELIISRTICPGKYLIIVSGNVDAVEASIDAGKNAGEGFIVDELILPYVHASIFPALAASVELSPGDRDALGVIETFSAISAIKCADAACKAAEIILFSLHLSMAVGGKGYFCFTGDVASVHAAANAAADLAKEDGLLAGKVIIPRPRDELFEERI